MLVKIKKLKSNAIIPTRMSNAAAGYDLYACLDKDITIFPRSGTALIPTGISIQIPEGYEAQIRPRSGIAFKYSVTVLNAPATIDSDYRGELQVLLINHNIQYQFLVQDGMRIAQLVIAKHESPEFDLVEDLDNTERNINGFGSTGIKINLL
jgi:dUTP pyrophosphatase